MGQWDDDLSAFFENDRAESKKAQIARERRDAAMLKFIGQIVKPAIRAIAEDLEPHARRLAASFKRDSVHGRVTSADGVEFEFLIQKASSAAFFHKEGPSGCELLKSYDLDAELPAVTQFGADFLRFYKRAVSRKRKLPDKD